MSYAHMDHARWVEQNNAASNEIYAKRRSHRPAPEKLTPFQAKVMKRGRRQSRNSVETVPRFGPQERALRVAMDRASVFASEKRHDAGLSKIQMVAVRVTIPAIVTGLAMLDRRRVQAKYAWGEMTESALRENEADAVLWLLWLDVVRGIFQSGSR